MNFFRDKNGYLVIVQRPNLPIILWSASYLGAWIVGENSGFDDALQVISFVTLSWWAALEFIYGDSPFRQVLGLSVLILTLVNL